MKINDYINNEIYGNNNDSNKDNGGKNTMNDTINSNTNENNNNRLMSNAIRSTRAAEKAEREAREREAAKKARLDAIDPLGIPGIADLINRGILRPYIVDGKLMGLMGGSLVGELQQRADGSWNVIVADTPKDLAELKQQIKAGRDGDGAYKAWITCEGYPYPIPCAGKTPEELDEQVNLAEETMTAILKGLAGSKETWGSSVECAVNLADLEQSGELSNNLKEIIGRDGHKYIIVYDDNYVMSLSGRTKATLDDIKSSLEDADKETILTERLDAVLVQEEAERAAYLGEYEDEDDWEEYDEDEDDEDGENYILGIYDENYELR